MTPDLKADSIRSWITAQPELVSCKREPAGFPMVSMAVDNALPTSDAVHVDAAVPSVSSAIPKLSLMARNAVRAPGSLCAEAGTGHVGLSPRPYPG